MDPLLSRPLLIILQPVDWNGNDQPYFSFTLLEEPSTKDLILWKRLLIWIKVDVLVQLNWELRYQFLAMARALVLAALSDGLMVIFSWLKLSRLHPLPLMPATGQSGPARTMVLPKLLRA
jgi:hypothetical protein